MYDLEAIQDSSIKSTYREVKAMDIRSGRFKKSDVSGTSALTVVAAKKGGALYRFFNSGLNEFKIMAGGKTQVVLKPTYSVDVGAAGDLVITTDAAIEVEGMYDILTDFRPIRSGRFKILKNTATQHPVIVRDQNQNGEVYYRFFNSGNPDSKFMILGVGRDQTAIEPGLSVDVAVPKNTTIYVQGTDNTIPIEGIYEYLGTD